MKRIFLSGGCGLFIGFVLFAFLFSLTARGGDQGILPVLALMASIPIGVFFSLLSAFRILQQELQETRREMKHWQSSFQLMRDDDIKPPPHDGIKPSTQVRSGEPPKRD